MKILGNGDTASKLEFNLGSLNLRMQCFLFNVTDWYVGELKPDNEAIITFRDSKEILDLIKMLQKFQERVDGQIGGWEKVE